MSLLSNIGEFRTKQALQGTIYLVAIGDKGKPPQGRKRGRVMSGSVQTDNAPLRVSVIDIFYVLYLENGRAKKYIVVSVSLIVYGIYDFKVPMSAFYQVSKQFVIFFECHINSRLSFRSGLKIFPAGPLRPKVLRRRIFGPRHRVTSRPCKSPQPVAVHRARFDDISYRLFSWVHTSNIFLYSL